MYRLQVQQGPRERIRQFPLDVEAGPIEAKAAGAWYRRGAANKGNKTNNNHKGGTKAAGGEEPGSSWGQGVKQGKPLPSKEGEP